MATANVPNSITPNTPAEAGPIEANFEYLQDFANNDVVHVDGTKAFTGVPSGPTQNPTSDNQFTRKRYVDDRTKLVFEHNVTADTNQWARFGSDFDWLGVSKSFTFPEILAGSVFTITATVPTMLIANTGGDWPIAGAAMDVGLFFGESTRLTLAASAVPPGLAFTPDAAPSIFLQRTFTNNNQFAAGSTQSLNLRGRIRHGNAGQFRLQISGTYPVQLLGKMG